MPRFNEKVLRGRDQNSRRYPEKIRGRKWSEMMRYSKCLAVVPEFSEDAVRQSKW
jgi:hypothetical protein